MLAVPAAVAALATPPTPETDLVGFAWLVGFVLAGFLILARLSQGAVGGDSAVGDDGAVGGDSADESDESTERERKDDSDASATEPEIDRTSGAAGRDSEATDAEESRAVADPLASDGPVERWPTAGDRPGKTNAERQIESVAAPGEDPAMSPGLLLLNVALTQGLFGAILAGGAWYFGVPLGVLGVGGGGLSTGWTALAVGVGFGAVLWVGNELASGLAADSGADYDEGLRELLAPEGPRGWTLLFGATLPTIAVVEEFVFRASVVGAVAAAFGTSPWLLAVVSSVAFALGHGAQGRVGVLVTGGLGFALAAGFVVTNSLLAVVVAHYLVNALEFLVHEGLGLPDPVWS